MKIFLDVGAHIGQTLKVVTDPRCNFDKIYSFEPSEDCWSELTKYENNKVIICKYGLWNKTVESILYNSGDMGASIFADKGRNTPGVGKICKFIKASDWIRDNIATNDNVYLKLNCEGAECDIIEDLIDSGEIDKIKLVMIDFDVRKIPSQRHREQQIREKINQLGIRSKFLLREDIMKPGLSKSEMTAIWFNELIK